MYSWFTVYNMNLQWRVHSGVLLRISQKRRDLCLLGKSNFTLLWLSATYKNHVSEDVLFPFCFLRRDKNMCSKWAIWLRIVLILLFLFSFSISNPTLLNTKDPWFYITFHVIIFFHSGSADGLVKVWSVPQVYSSDLLPKPRGMAGENTQVGFLSCVNLCIIL